MRPRSSSRFLLVLAPLFCATACGPDEAGAVAPAMEAGAAPAAALGRVDDDEMRELRRLLDLGHLERALPLLDKRAPALGVEGELLRARAAQLAGNDVEAGRLIEAARRAAPRSPEVCAVAAELHAAAGRLETARDELKQGLLLAGAPTPELLRAQGVLFLCRPGGAERGLELLERARAADPALPFCERALGQAQLLRAKEAMRAGDRNTALAATLRSLEHDPEDIDARRFLVDAYAAHLMLEESLAVLEALIEEGQPLDNELALMEKRGAMAALLRKDRPRALELFRRARDRGLDAEELGTGARILAEAGVTEYERALELLGEGRAEDGETALEQALAYAPDYLAARYHLGVLAYQRDDFALAADHFARVVAIAEQEALELPDPAHISLAHALRGAGRPADATAALRRYLELRPDGEHAAATRKALDAFEQG